jgi:hypothetical protein
MLGRVMFALVWLFIAAGVALPLYRPDVATPGAPAAASALLVADTMTSSCANHADGGDSRSTCPCGQALATASAAPEPCVSLTVYVIVRPLPSGPPSTPRPPPPKLPAI